VAIGSHAGSNHRGEGDSLKTVVLWDLDGTIQDSESLARAGTRQGFQSVLRRDPTQEEYAALTGRPARIVYQNWFEESLASQILAEGTRFYEAHAGQIVCYPQIRELLTILHQQSHRMGVVTSKRSRHVTRELQLQQLESVFDAVVTQEDTLLHKPHPEPLLLAAQRMQADATDCIYIGDQPTDIEAAHRAGMRSIAALWGEGNIDKLANSRPTIFAQAPMDILVLLQAST
jgi:pyrophosphatase PpaX